jgi:ferredoxin
MKYYVTERSGNPKTGPMPVVTISKASCSTTCLLMGNGCYAETGNLSFFWARVTSGEIGVDFTEFVEKVRRLPYGLWRYGQAGDLPGDGDDIDHDMMSQLVKANRRRPVICYTHKPMTESNRRAIDLALEYNFHINVSANNVTEADTFSDMGYSTVVLLDSAYGRKKKAKLYQETLGEYRERLMGLERSTPGGRKIAVCPAAYTTVNCLSCGICAKARPNGVVVGFPAHGTRTRKVNDLVRNGNEAA